MKNLEDSSLNTYLYNSGLAYKGSIWNVMKDIFLFNNNKITREYIKHPGAVAILALNKKNEIFLIKQYRHAIKKIEWEIPAGLLDIKNETILKAAKRELYEEADLQASKWDILLDFYTTPGSSNESIRIYLAQDISEAKENFNRIDEEATMEIGWFHINEIVESIIKGKIHNSILCLGVMTLEHYIKSGIPLNNLRPSRK